MKSKLNNLLKKIQYKNPYSILEIDENGDIKKAYKNLALKYHPDKNTTKTTKEQTLAKQKFLDISIAYEILTDHNDDYKKFKNFNTENENKNENENENDDLKHAIIVFCKFSMEVFILNCQNNSWFSNLAALFPLLGFLSNDKQILLNTLILSYLSNKDQIDEEIIKMDSEKQSEILRALRVVLEHYKI